MSFKKISDLERKRCVHPEHNPPHHIVLPDGLWEWTCPACGQVQMISVVHPVHNFKWTGGPSDLRPMWNNSSDHKISDTIAI